MRFVKRILYIFAQLQRVVFDDVFNHRPEHCKKMLESDALFNPLYLFAYYFFST